MIVTMKPKVRGNTGSGTGLSSTQRKLLLWLLQQEETIKASGDANKIKGLNQKGVPWSAKRFYDDAHGQAMPKGQGQSISRTLKALEDSGRKDTPRHLIERYDTTGGTGAKGRTSHIRLTPEGRHAANFEREHGMTRRQIFEKHKRDNMHGYLEHFRESKREFQEAIAQEKLGLGPVSVNHPWEPDYTVSSDSAAFDRLFDDIIKSIYGLTVKLDLPRTPDEIEHYEYMGRHSLNLPF